MDRRNFIKTIAAATAAPLALLKAKPTIKPVADGGHKSIPFDGPKLGDIKTDDAGRVFRYVKFESTPNDGEVTIKNMSNKDVFI